MDVKQKIMFEINLEVKAFRSIRELLEMSIKQQALTEHQEWRLSW